MEKAVQAFINKHQLLTSNSKVLVAVSGGPDSMALLHFLYQRREKWNLKLVVLSVDHQLRGKKSEEDLAYVEDVCKKWQIEFHGTSLDVPSYEATHKVSTEVAAREMRYKFFSEKMQELGGNYLAFGHHGDDQVETLLMKLVRSASATAFSGIPVRRNFAGGEIIRPLLAVTKAEIEAYCTNHQIEVRTDPTNFEDTYTRNFYRKHIVPLLKEKNNNIHITAQHLSETLQEDERFLQKQAEAVVQNAVTFSSENRQAELEINLFKKHDQSLQRRAFHLILNYLYETLPNQLSYAHEEAFFKLFMQEAGNAEIHFPNALVLCKVYDKLIFYFETKQSTSQSFHQILKIPDRMLLPDGATITVDLAKHQQNEHRFSFNIATSEVKLPLQIRNRLPGDRMTWKGLNGTKKLKDIFIDEKVPLRRRDTWPVLVDSEGRILWLIGLRKGLRKEISNEAFIYIEYEIGSLQEA
ncbi:tRNA lysidine(34) synthetase TilS [Oceanobacillus sp. CAU 1775]